MRLPQATRPSRLALTATLLIAGPAAALAAPSPPSSVAARDTFVGSISSVKGPLHGYRGNMTITLSAPVATGARRLRLTFHPRACPAQRRCVLLAGRLTGTLTAVASQIPDTGAGFTVEASGPITPLGHLSARGTAHGTGFIAQGHESLRLALVYSAGTVTITAQSRLVPGFTAP